MNRTNHHRQDYRRPAFTLVELLVTISVIAIMATFVMVASYSAMESAKEAKTKATITKLNNMIMAKYEGFRTRRVALTVPPNSSFAQVAKARLDCLHELMRMELPDRWSDVLDPPISSIARPAVSQAYLRRYNQVTNNGNNVPPTFGLHQGAECLFMIVTLGLTDELGGRDHFNEATIGDTDGDGFPEFLDEWKNPIRFLRWAPGFPSELQLGTTAGVVASASSATSVVGNPQLSNVDNAYVGRAIWFTSGNLKNQGAQIVGYQGGSQTFTLYSGQLGGTPSAGDSFVIRPEDPFDPRHVYPLPPPPPPQTAPLQSPTFALYPLIYSAGPDEIFDVLSDVTMTSGNALAYSTLNNNPFVGYRDSTFTSGQVGSIADLFSTSRNGIQSPPNSVNNAADNIHNHMLETKVNR